MPTPVTGEVLERAGISPSLTSRTLYALQTLDLIDEQGKPTGVLEGIRLAPEAEYHARLAEWLNNTYADVVAYVDPSQDDEIKIRDAFRSYTPVGQQSRMVSLFMGLYAAAGIMPERPAKPRPVRQSRPIAIASKTIPRKSTSKAAPAADSSGVPAPLAGLLATLPPHNKGWTKEDRDRFLTTFTAVIDYCIPVVENVAAEEGEDHDDT
jgi:hypothetical protein